jgi:hypothetical protein
MIRNGKTNVILVDSPVEFILIGPIYDNLKVLVKSKNAGIDLIGFSQDENNNEYVNGSSLFLTSLMPQKVYSRETEQLNHNNFIYDNFTEHYRDSTYKFIWRGVKNNRFNDIIEKTFNMRLYDIVSAIRNEDLDTLEWHLAVVISLCNTSILEKQKRRNRMLFIGIVYSLIIVITLLVYIF